LKQKKKRLKGAKKVTLEEAHKNYTSEEFSVVTDHQPQKKKQATKPQKKKSKVESPDASEPQTDA